MTMYLPNRDVRPTGSEPAEFIDPPAFVPEDDPPPETLQVHDDDEQ
jgi:hypothetical protein